MNNVILEKDNKFKDLSKFLEDKTKLFDSQNLEVTNLRNENKILHEKYENLSNKTIKENGITEKIIDQYLLK